LLKQFLHYLPWNLITFLEIPVYQRFLMLSLALEKQNVLFLQKMRWQKWVGCFRKQKLDGESITAVMDSTSEKMYLCQVPTFGVKCLS
jgi:hypothetical protein